MSSLWCCCFSQLLLQPDCSIQAWPWLCLPYHSSGRRKEGVRALTLALIVVLLALNPKVVDGGGWFQGGEVQWERWQMMWGESRTVKMIMASRGRASWLWLARPAFAYWHWEAKMSFWGKATGGWGLGFALENKKVSQQGKTQSCCVVVEGKLSKHGKLISFQDTQLEGKAVLPHLHLSLARWNVHIFEDLFHKHYVNLPPFHIWFPCWNLPPDTRDCSDLSLSNPCSCQMHSKNLAT